MTTTLPFNYKIKTTQEIVKGEEFKNTSFIETDVFFINKFYTKKILTIKERSPNVTEIYDADKEILITFFFGSLEDFAHLLIDKKIIYSNKQYDLQTDYTLTGIATLMAFFNIAR